METRARFVLIGGVTLFSLLGALGFLLWLAKVQIDRTYTQYDIRFDTVAGLSEASAVRYNGIDVGRVLSIGLDQQNPALVRVRIEIYASTPVRVDTVAVLSSQGVTGVSFVSLEGGSIGADRLTITPPATVAEIPAEASVVQGLMDDVPDLLAEAQILIEGLSRFTTPENQDQVAAILVNVNAATARFDALASRADTVLASVEAALAQADTTMTVAQTAFTNANTVITTDLPATITGLVDSAEVTFAQANTTLSAAQTAFERADTVLQVEVAEIAAQTRSVLIATEATLAEAQTTFATASALVTERAPGIMDRFGSAADALATAAAGLSDFSQSGLPQYSALASDARALMATLSALADRIAADPGRFLLGDQTPLYRR
jgi:phospholipid/cholesterol/gamma-HCH transport system substrate-binding protein